MKAVLNMRLILHYKMADNISGMLLSAFFEVDDSDLELESDEYDTGDSEYETEDEYQGDYCTLLFFVMKQGTALTHLANITRTIIINMINRESCIHIITTTGKINNKQFQILCLRHPRDETFISSI